MKRIWGEGGEIIIQSTEGGIGGRKHPRPRGSYAQTTKSDVGEEGRRSLKGRVVRPIVKTEGYEVD